jgi:hypothetical protein
MFGKKRDRLRCLLISVSEAAIRNAADAAGGVGLDERKAARSSAAGPTPQRFLCLR